MVVHMTACPPKDSAENRENRCQTSSQDNHQKECPNIGIYQTHLKLASILILIMTDVLFSFVALNPKQAFTL